MVSYSMRKDKGHVYFIDDKSVKHLCLKYGNFCLSNLIESPKDFLVYIKNKITYKNEK